MSDKLKIVLDALNNKDLATASITCSDWRNEDSSSALAYNLSGVVAMWMGDLLLAVSWFETATKLDPDYAKAWCNLGIAYKQSKRGTDGVFCITKALELSPSDLDVRYNLALLLHEMGNNEEAKALLNVWPSSVHQPTEVGWLLAKVTYAQGEKQKACEIMAGLIESHCHRHDLWCAYGNLLQEIDQESMAEYAYREAIRLAPDDSESLRGLGKSLVRQSQFNEGCLVLRRVVELNQNDSSMLIDYAQALVSCGIFVDARQLLQTALQRWPANAELHFNLGLVEGEHGDRTLAENSIQRAIALDPKMHLAHNYLGVLLEKRGQMDAARESYCNALLFDVNFAEAYNNLGNLLWRELSLDSAERSYRKAIELKPDFSEAHHNLSLLLLVTGRFDEGWREYEWRWKILEARPHVRMLDCPEWCGECLVGKSILVYAEQGFGDTLQFVRYMPLLSQRGVKVIFESPPQLLRLLKSMKGIDSLVERGAPLPACDYCVPLLNVPGLVGTRSDSIPSQVPYLQTDQATYEKWGRRVSAIGPGYRVGLAWAGNPKHINDQCRSMLPEDLTPLVGIDNVNWISLYKRPSATRSSVWLSLPIPVVDWTEEFMDFADTAAVIEHLDLVITVDTSVAHLAGALGKPVWVMLPFAPDWRWRLDVDTSPWYPSATLFRQTRKGLWKDALGEIAHALQRMLEQA